MALPPVTAEMAVVFGLLAVALALFVTEALPTDVTAIGLLVAVVALERWTGVGARAALAGFASPATLTIVAMYVLSDGVQRTGVVEVLGARVGAFTGESETRLLAAIVGITGPVAGFVNNTPVVAVFVPMVSGLAERADVSPSTVLLPLSYAAMLGGTLTLVGTATNLVASSVATDLGVAGLPFSMFEFTPLGLLVFAVGTAYLLTVGRRLVPARIEPGHDLAERFAVHTYLARVRVRDDSPLVGLRPRDVFEPDVAFDPDLAPDVDVDALELVRDGERFRASATDQRVAAGDELTLRIDEVDLDRFEAAYGVRHLPWVEVSVEELRATGPVVALVVPPDSAFLGDTVAEARLDKWFDATVLGVRRGDETLHAVDDLELRAGDALLVRTGGDLTALHETRELVVASEVGEGARKPSLTPNAPVALGIVAAVVGLAALGVVPIAIAALGGVVAMVVTGCLDVPEAYDAVNWSVVFLLAGLLPLGEALRVTGADALVAGVLASTAGVAPPLAVLALVGLLTGALASLVTPVASVVVMTPIAVDTAGKVGASAYAFVLATTFAASTAFATPVGYQTNLMVYGPGGYRFTDYVRVGVPLQVLLTAVTAVGIAALWGVA